MELTLAAQPWQMWVVYGAIMGAIVSYSLERWSVEIVSVGVLCILLVFFHFFPLPGGGLTASDILEGFANPALISIMALLVVGQGLYQSGAFDRTAQALGGLARVRPRATLVGVLLMILAISAVLSNTPVVLMFIPIMSLIAAHASITPSKIMMPISYMSILGGMTTLIGSSTNLLAADAVKDLVDFKIGFFDFFVPGLGMAALGALYTLGIAPRILPRRAPLIGTVAAESGKQFIGQLVLSPGHPLVGQSPVAGHFTDLPDITVRLVERAGQRVLPPFEDLTLLAGDVLVIAATRAAITRLLAARPDMLAGMLRHEAFEAAAPGADGKAGAELVVTEAVIAPGSRLIGNTIELIRFIEGSGVTVLGIQRRSRMLRTGLRDIRLEPGDVLLLLGTERDIEGLRPNRDVIVFEWMTGAVPNLKAANRARLIFGGMVLTAASGLLPIVVAAFLAAGLMITTGVLNIRQAARAVDRRIFLLIGAAIAMGTALEHTGGATYLSSVLVHNVAPFGPAILLSAFFLATAVMTNVLSNAATAVLFAPIAVSTALAVGADPRPFIHAVIFATNCSFATPIAYQTNLLVMGAGHYTFRDYLTTGIPLILFLWLTFSLLAPWYYGL